MKRERKKKKQKTSRKEQEDLRTKERHFKLVILLAGCDLEMSASIWALYL